MDGPLRDDDQEVVEFGLLLILFVGIVLRFFSLIWILCTLLRRRCRLEPIDAGFLERFRTALLYNLLEALLFIWCFIDFVERHQVLIPKPKVRVLESSTGGTATVVRLEVFYL